MHGMEFWNIQIRNRHGIFSFISIHQFVYNRIIKSKSLQLKGQATFVKLAIDHCKIYHIMYNNITVQYYKGKPQGVEDGVKRILLLVHF